MSSAAASNDASPDPLTMRFDSTCPSRSSDEADHDFGCAVCRVRRIALEFVEMGGQLLLPRGALAPCAFAGSRRGRDRMGRFRRVLQRRRGGCLGRHRLGRSLRLNRRHFWLFLLRLLRLVRRDDPIRIVGLGRRRFRQIAVLDHRFLLDHGGRRRCRLGIRSDRQVARIGPRRRQLDADLDRRRAEVRIAVGLHRNHGQADAAGMKCDGNDAGDAQKLPAINVEAGASPT